MSRLWVFLLLVPVFALAQAPETSLRPKPRPDLAPPAVVSSSAAPRRSLRPKARPDSRSETSAAVAKVVVEDTISDDIRRADTPSRVPETQAPSTVPRIVGSARDAGAGVGDATAGARELQSGNPAAVARASRPKTRPGNLRTALRELRRDAPKRYAKKGSVCGVRGIRGRSVAPVRGKGGCGFSDAVRITEVDGVALSRELLVGCNTARTLHDWVRTKAHPTIGRKGGGLARIRVVAGYACRTRNSRRGAKLSEHAKGNAVDIAGFELKNGTKMSVLRDYRSGPHSQIMRRLHKSACGPFGTVLGPFSDRYHQDHFHFDVARHRSGAYCR